MNGPVRALLWEIWRTSWKDSLSRLCGAVAAVLLMCLSTTREGLQASEALRGVVVLVAGGMAVLSQLWIRELDSEHAGFAFRLGFVRPVRTATLVLVPLAYCALLAVASYLIPAMLFAFMADVSMPLLGPTFVIVCAVACLTAACWAPVTVVDKLLGMIAVCGLVAGLIFRFHATRGFSAPFVLAMGDPEYYRAGLLPYAVLVSVTAVAAGLAVLAVDRQRHGEGFSLSGWRRADQRVEPVVRAFRSPITAQLWYEFRRCIRIVGPPALAAPFLVYALARFGRWMHSGETAQFTSPWEGAPVLWLVGLVLSPLVYQMLGADAVLGLRKREGVVRFSAFDATRPLTSEASIIIKLMVTGGCSILGWLWMWAGALTYAFFGQDGRVHTQVAEILARQVGEIPGWWWWGLVVSAALFFVSSTSVLFGIGLWLPRYPRRFAAVFGAAYAAIMLAFVDGQRGWQFAPAWRAAAYVCGGAIALVCIYAMRKAVSERSISVRSLRWIAGWWVIYVATTVAISWRFLPAGRLPPAVLVLAAVSLLIPLGATVAGPLALSGQRHQA